MSTDIPVSEGEATQSSTPTELALASLWREVLQLSKLPVADDNFFALGGDSMTMVMLEFRIQEEFGAELSAGTVLGSPSLRELSLVVDDARARSHQSR